MRHSDWKSRFVLVASTVTVIDLVTKHWVCTMPQLQGMAILPPYIHISYAVNSGIFLRLFDDWQNLAKPYYLAGMTLVPALAIIVYHMRVSADKALPETPLGLIVGGLLGNFADRILHGGIIDFIEVHVGNSIYYPTFNVADLAATAGMLMLLIHGAAKSISSATRLPSS